jgi:hypothetical protein
MKKISDWIKTWTVPQAIVVLGALACVTALAISITMSDGWGKLVTWLSDGQHQALLLSLAAFLGALYHRALGLDPAKSDPQPQRVPPSREQGSVAIEVLGAIVFGAFAFVLLHGCSPSQLQVQAASTVVAMHAVRVAGDAVHADEQRARDACADDACLAANRAAHQSAEVAIDALRTGVRAWIAADLIALDVVDDPSTAVDEVAVAERVAAEAYAALPALAAEVVHEIIDAGGVIPPELAALIPGAS